MRKRQKVKVRKVFRKTKKVLQELGSGAAYAIRH